MTTIKITGPAARSLLHTIGRDTFDYEGQPEQRIVTTQDGQEVPVWWFQFDNLAADVRMIVMLRTAYLRVMSIIEADAHLRRAGWAFPCSELEVLPKTAQEQAE